MWFKDILFIFLDAHQLEHLCVLLSNTLNRNKLRLNLIIVRWCQLTICQRSLLVLTVSMITYVLLHPLKFPFSQCIYANVSHTFHNILSHYSLELIPRQARACPDPPLYLRLRMGRQIGKTTPLPTTVMSYGKNKLRPEYWFSIPKNK